LVSQWKNYLKLFTSFWIVFFSLFFPSISHSAAWNLEPGKYQLINTFSTYNSDSYHDYLGNKISQSDFNKYEFKSSLEYGATEAITVGVEPSFTRSSIDGGNSANALTSVDILARFSVNSLMEPVLSECKKEKQKTATACKTVKFLSFFDGWVYSVQPKIKLGGTYSDKDSNLFGEKKDSFELRFLAGKNVEFFTLDSFINNEFYFVNDQAGFDFSFGVNVNENYMFLSQLFSSYSVNSFSASEQAYINNPDSYDLMKIQISLVSELTKNTRLQLGFYHDVVARNIGYGSGFIVSTWTDF
jgi:hypothetical protein